MNKVLSSLLVLGLLISISNSVVYAVEVNKETKDLILQSIKLELSNNLSLRDPLDNNPLEIAEKKIEILGLSVENSVDDGSTTFIYQVEVPFTTLDGDGGVLLCNALNLDKDGIQKALKADCVITRIFSSLNTDGSGLSIDDMFDMIFNEL